MEPARLLCPWDFPGKNTGVGCHFLPQGIFPTQGLNSSLCKGGFFTTESPGKPHQSCLYRVKNQENFSACPEWIAGGSVLEASPQMSRRLVRIPGLPACLRGTAAETGGLAERKGVGSSPQPSSGLDPPLFQTTWAWTCQGAHYTTPCSAHSTLPCQPW